MDMKNLLTNDKPDWNRDMETKLNRFPIVLHSDQWMKGTGLHYHPGLEIHVTNEGVGTMVVGRQILLQAPRSVLFFRGMVPHQMISKSSYKRTVISCDFGDDDDATTNLHRLAEFSWIPQDSCLSFTLSPKESVEMESLCKALQRELRERRIGWERMALAHVLQITVFLQRSSTDPEHVAASSAASRNIDLLQMCSDYVCRNLGAELSLRAVARRFAVSEEHLTRSFTREMGISFYQYVLLQRTAEAKRLLREAPDLSISDIAHMIGFASSSHFSRQFRALTEESPSAYRQKVQST